MRAPKSWMLLIPSIKNKFKSQVRAFCYVAHWFEFYLRSLLGAGGMFRVDCVGPDGALKWTTFAKNGVTGLGLDDILNKYFRAGTPPSTWYLGLINNSGFTALAGADTAASHAGWTELTAYSNANRPTWSPAASSGGAGSIVNGTTTDFNINANTQAVKGLFAITDNTIGGTSGLLWATAAFSGGVQNCNSGDTLKCTYTISAVSG